MTKCRAGFATDQLQQRNIYRAKIAQCICCEYVYPYIYYVTARSDAHIEELRSINEKIIYAHRVIVIIRNLRTTVFCIIKIIILRKTLCSWVTNMDITRSQEIPLRMLCKFTKLR